MEMTSAVIAAKLDQTLDAAAPRLRAISEESAGTKADPGHWSHKEVLGHLIDSAANNHQRFVRLQIQDTVVMPAYQQNEWVRVQKYQERSWEDLVDLWLAYNRHLAHIMWHADDAAARHVWKTPDAQFDLEFLIADYVSHMRRHLEQIVGALPVY